MKWSVVEQWKMRLDGEERQMRNAELDDVDEKSASKIHRKIHRKSIGNP